MNALYEEMQTFHQFHQNDTSNTTKGLKRETQTFHHFLDLPLEIRRKIWRRALRLFPRIIEVRPRLTPTRAWDPLTTKHHVRATAPIVLLAINHEVRKELLPFYTTLSSDVSLNHIPDSDSDLRSVSPDPSAKPPLVNFEIDIIYFNVAWSTSERIPYLSFVKRLFEDFKHAKQFVRRLAVCYKLAPETFWLSHSQDIIKEESVIFQFVGLEELAIIASQTHLRTDKKLVGLADVSEDDPFRANNKGGIERLVRNKEWTVPVIRLCDTVAAEKYA
ncbi:hypothetical protein SBOR_3016 [Sclerotinia borealis F-4128]|uniref:2EXR domain-containing protein n=1 Tax=Sclerotinia borealis (strain F-4128) TaxID=1432307 RepID=W9CPN8_SCLBF|nr:hypothetical protein SBOR_3016 [Sclerotinia borealis F-4128]